MARTLSDFLEKAGVKLASPAAAPVADAGKTAAAVPATAPAKTATPVKAAGEGKGTIPPAQPSVGEANKGHKVRDEKNEHEAQDTGAAGAKAASKTAQQLDLERAGIVVSDPKLAADLHAELVKKAEADKRAAQAEKAAEVRAYGALIYQGMIQENTAWKLATGEASLDEAASVAKALGVSLEDIRKQAEQIGGALPSPALVGGNLGSAARVDNSVVMRKGEEAKQEIQTRDVEAIGGTRAPVSGADDKLKKFTDVITLPGNPGLNHGQAVDQGKALGA
jgi:hypothetical protein